MMTKTARLTLRVATYNVHGCVGMDRQRSEQRIAEVIASAEVDVIALQELDVNRARSTGVDQAAVIAEQLGWRHFFEAAMQFGEGQYGNAILSRYPLRQERRIELPGEGSWYCRERRVALAAELEMDFGAVRIVNAHFGLGRAERLLQARSLMSEEWLMATAPTKPSILLGDFNSRPSSETIALLQQHLRSVRAVLPAAGKCRTYPTRLPAVAVDHVFVNALLQPKMLQVHRTPLARVASDHYPLIAELAARGSSL